MCNSHAQNSAREAVLSVLRDVVGQESITLADDFYLIGGHSMLIAETCARLRTEFGLELPVGQFAMNSQVAALADACQPVAARSGAS